jgi:hypothetical protein
LCLRCLEALRRLYARRLEGLQALARGDVRAASLNRALPKLVRIANRRPEEKDPW